MNFVKAAIAPALLVLAGCVTSPYQTAFTTCDDEAGACYRYCAEISESDEDGAACRADCEAGANQCFADAYDRYSYAGSTYSRSSAYYQPSWPWYGRYGAWGPRRGYYFDFTYWGRSSGYYPPRHRRGDRHRYRSDRDGRRGDRNRPRGPRYSDGDNAGSPSAEPPTRRSSPRRRATQEPQTGRTRPQQTAPNASDPSASPQPRRRTTRPARRSTDADNSGQPEFTMTPGNDD